MPEPAATRGVTVVTGASSGIGEGFARRLAAQGHDLVLVARRRERLETLAAELGSAHGIRAHPVAVDLADPAGPARLVAEIEEAGLEVHGLVNAAGFGTAGPFAGEDPARLAAEIQLDVTALTVLTRLLLPALIAHRGMLVQVSSTASFQPLPGIAVYAAAKAYVAFRELSRPVPGPVRTVGRRNALQGWVARVAPRRARLGVAARLTKARP
ncbi:MAG: SDR family NAD(P)-dependent oxidoreductase [Cellulomonadaceae bacterium]